MKAAILQATHWGEVSKLTEQGGEHISYEHTHMYHIRTRYDFNMHDI